MRHEIFRAECDVCKIAFAEDDEDGEYFDFEWIDGGIWNFIQSRMFQRQGWGFKMCGWGGLKLYCPRCFIEILTERFKKMPVKEKIYSPAPLFEWNK